MAGVETRSEKLAHNAVLTLISRGLLGLITVLFVPGVLALFNMADNVKNLANANAMLRTELVQSQGSLKTELSARIDQAEARLNLRLAPVENRQDYLQARTADTDRKLDDLTRNVNNVTTQVAVLVERINQLLAASPPGTSPTLRR